MRQLLKNRIRRVLSKLESRENNCALLLSSAPAATRSHDTQYPYRQDSNFYYLTGSEERDLCLFLSNRSSTPTLFAQKVSRERILWEGAPDSLQEIADNLGAELVITTLLKAEVLSRLKGTVELFHQNTPGSIGFEIAADLFRRPPHQRYGFPRDFLHVDSLLEELRLIKDKGEVDAIRKSIKISYESLQRSLNTIRSGTSEFEIGSTIDYWMALQKGVPAFKTIVAAGANAAVLHHERLKGTLKEKDLLLLDWGAEHNMYASDLTRVFPISGTFNSLQTDLYSIVLEAQKAAISKICDGAQIKTVYNAAARVLTQGLVHVGVLKGKLSALMSREAFKPYFPHGIGHPLGLDVHDVGQIRPDRASLLKKGMVLTIEPGLYFSKKTGSIPACGIRIEDDVLVTHSGSEVLSYFVAKSIAEVESLLR